MKAAALQKLRTEFARVLVALRDHGQELAQIEGLAAVRPGYAIDGDAKHPALVLALHPGQLGPDTAALSRRWGVTVRRAVASPEEQILGAKRVSFISPLLGLLDPLSAPGFDPPERGTYQPPRGPGAPTLGAIHEEMEVTLCASPDAGWPVLRDFLGEGVTSRLTVAMYDFTAPHVEDALTDALRDTDATFRLVLDGKTATGAVGGNGVNGDDQPEADVLERLHEALGERFEPVRASVGAGRAVPRAYHIKVAVVDDERLWLSSGNWQSSNLAPFDFAEPEDAPPLPISRYNRDYHVVVKNAALAQTFGKFIEYDASLGQALAGPEAADEPTLLLPDEPEEPEDFAPTRRFRPLTVSGRIKVTPLLTPDNFPSFINRLLASAKQRVWIQNQYIEPKHDGDNFPEFERLMELLGELAESVDLRLSLRNPKAAFRDRILAAGVLPSQIRRQSNCHGKLIVVDDRCVVIGSQNLSNLGFVANRDASLAFEDAEIVAYYSEIFAHDWGRARPSADADSFSVRVASNGETLPGHTRVPWSALFDTPPPTVQIQPAVTQPAVTQPAVTQPAVTPPAVTPPASIPAALALSSDVPLFGVNEDGERSFESLPALAAALRESRGSIEVERSELGKLLGTASFGVPIGASAERLEDVGWGVVWGPGVPERVKVALRPLLEHRQREVNDALLFQELEYRAGESPRQFLQRHGVDFGTVRPEAVPYYLLLVGTPEQIPFSFQTLLDVEYRVGRLDLSGVEGYTQYARSLVSVESGSVTARDRVLHAFGPAHQGDAPTELSVEVLVRAASRWLSAFAKLRVKHGLSSRTDAGDAATKARLLEILRGTAGRAEVLFSAGHGLGISSGNPRQPGEQGALVTADWDGISAIDAASRFAAADLPADADLCGLVVFLFACFGAGTPAADSFPTRAGQVLASEPFVSALPKALLAHPKGAALGVFGHVDRTLTWSLQPPGAPVATDPFAKAALNVLAGNRLGAALDDLNQRAASLGSSVADALRPGSPPIDDRELVKTWTEQRDATAFLLLGDPAARLRR